MWADSVGSKMSARRCDCEPERGVAAGDAAVPPLRGCAPSDGVRVLRIDCMPTCDCSAACDRRAAEERRGEMGACDCIIAACDRMPTCGCIPTCDWRAAWDCMPACGRIADMDRAPTGTRAGAGVGEAEADRARIMERSPSRSGFITLITPMDRWSRLDARRALEAAAAPPVGCSAAYVAIAPPPLETSCASDRIAAPPRDASAAPDIGDCA